MLMKSMADLVATATLRRAGIEVKSALSESDAQDDRKRAGARPDVTLRSSPVAEQAEAMKRIRIAVTLLISVILVLATVRALTPDEEAPRHPHVAGLVQLDLARSRFARVHAAPGRRPRRLAPGKFA